jgi:hypothetical protein
MIRYYRLRQGRLSWSSRGDFDVREQLAGRIGLPSVEPDRDAWRIVIPLTSEEFEARISVRLDEPEFQTIASGLMSVDLGSDVTILGTGQIGGPGGQLAPICVLGELEVERLLVLADGVVDKMRLGLLERLKNPARR